MREHGVGWVTAAPPLITAVRSAKQFLTYVSSRPGAFDAVASYRVGRGTAPAHGPMNGLAVCVEPPDHLGTGQLLVVEVEEHRFPLKHRLDLLVTALDASVLRDRYP